MADLQARAQSRLSEKPKKLEEYGVDEFECPACRDTEFIFYTEYKDENDKHGIQMARPCECRERKAWKRRFKQSMIPDEFTNANFKNYQQFDDIQKQMYDTTLEYLKHFRMDVEDNQKNKTIPYQNFGLVAVFGEQRLKELPPSERSAMKQKHNNFGIGKTHLQIALAKHLIKEGFNVLVVSDVVFIEELMQAKMMKDEGETYNRLLHNTLTADVLIWDDIGKVNWTEARERMYYTIINERYRKQKPIVFNSNEDRGTLAEKIGYAAASRLIGQAEAFLIEAEGTDYRLKKVN
ncbi:DNA replication protein [Peribacillus asahii]|uniref:DNA replication protein n=2 Tax=Peribacillus asahii TaxID=228899 RepID=A0A398BAE0_9BACI|nr:DNA replication protein [Peribacillus asahii]